MGFTPPNVGIDACLSVQNRDCPIQGIEALGFSPSQLLARLDLGKPIGALKSREDVRTALGTLDGVLDHLADEQAFKRWKEKGGLPFNRVYADLADALVLALYEPNGRGAQLLKRFEEVATAQDVAEVERRRGVMIGELAYVQPDVAAAREQLMDAYQSSIITVGEKQISVKNLRTYLGRTADAELRKLTYSAEMPGELVDALHVAMRTRNAFIRDHSSAQSVAAINMSLDGLEMGEVKTLITRLRTDLQPVFTNLFRELVSPQPIPRSDFAYLMGKTERELMGGVSAPTDSAELITMTAGLMRTLGYDQTHIDSYIIHSAPKMHFDLEERETKITQGGVTIHGGSTANTLFMVYNPLSFAAFPLRRTLIFPHELSHALTFAVAGKHVREGILAVPFAEYGSASHEVIAHFHELVAFDYATQKGILNVADQDRQRRLQKWHLLTRLMPLVSSSDASAELALHDRGEKTETDAAYVDSLTVQNDQGAIFLPDPPVNPSFYVTNAVLGTGPGQYYGYPIAEALAQTLAGHFRAVHGTLIHPEVGPAIAEHFMSGSEKPLFQRVAELTGIVDPIPHVVRSLHKQYDALSR